MRSGRLKIFNFQSRNFAAQPPWKFTRRKDRCNNRLHIVAAICCVSGALGREEIFALKSNLRTAHCINECQTADNNPGRNMRHRRGWKRSKIRSRFGKRRAKCILSKIPRHRTKVWAREVVRRDLRLLFSRTCNSYINESCRWIFVTRNMNFVKMWLPLRDCLNYPSRRNWNRPPVFKIAHPSRYDSSPTRAWYLEIPYANLI